MAWKHIYTIRMPDGMPLSVPRPSELPEPGDICCFTADYETPGDQKFSAGDELHLMKRTDEAPYGRLSSLGNWVVISKHGVNVWANIEWLLEVGRLSIDRCG